MSQRWLSTVIESAARGEERPTVVALRLLLHENDHDVDEAVSSALRSANRKAQARLTALVELLADARRRAPALRAVAAAGAAPIPAGEGLTDVGHWAAAFDQAARIDRDAASALYALGDPGRLQAATQEVCAYLDAAGFIAERTRVLDIGAGGGRILDALSPWIGFGVGVDISAEMLAGSRHHGNLAFLRTDGRNLRVFRDGAFDLALAVDSFPYLVASGVDEVHIAEAARILSPGGALVVMNYSYRGDAESDRIAFAAGCAAHGLVPVTLGQQPFALWNGAVYAARRIA
ncbi:MAG: methyltransferase domain-containing protein [Alphaproteobacteria bacterium]|nr:methyltransferase domain-containing protein [Alphaproteobacteria bacterium]